MTALTRRSLLAGGLLGLSACAQIPTSGPVLRVNGDLPQGTRRGVDVVAAPPVPGASPEAVVAGFIDAMANPGSDMAVARQYLTPEASARWAPEFGVTVFDGGTRASLAGVRGSLRANLVGRLDERGHFSTAAGVLLEHDFRVRRVDGQWRIGNPVTGLLVSQYTLQHQFMPVLLWFVSRTDQALVPEWVWLPGTTLDETQLVQALLAGPSAGLQSVADSAIPPGTTLGAAGVAAVDGQVRVDLGAPVAALADDDRELVGRQVAWTVRALEGARSVRLTQEGAVWSVPGDDGNGVLQLDRIPAPAGIPLAASQSAVLVQGGRVGSLAQDGAFTALSGPLGDGKFAPGVSLVGAVSDSGAVVVLDDARTGVHRWAPGQRLVERSATVRPAQCLAVRGSTVWIAQRGDASSSLVRLEGEAQAVPVRALKGASIAALAPSPDGTELALVLRRGKQSELGLLRVPRKGPVAWTTLPLYTSGTLVEQVVDVGWVTPGRLLVLGAVKAGASPTTFLVSSDGAQVDPMGPTGESGLVGLICQPQVQGVHALLRAGDGEVLVYETAWRWTHLASGTSAMAYPS